MIIVIEYLTMKDTHYFNVIITVFIHVNYYKPYNFIKSGMTRLKVVGVLQ